MKALSRHPHNRIVSVLILTLALVADTLHAVDWPTGDEIAQRINARDETAKELG